MKPPKHWKDVTIGDCCSIRHGYAFEGPDMSAQATDGPIVVSIGNFQYTGGFRFGATTLKRATVDPPKDYVLRPGDVLVAMTCQTPDGEILGIPGMIPDDGRTYLHNQRLGLVVSKKEVPTSKPFLFYIFCSQPFNRHLVERATGTKVKHTSPTTIESFEFALPPLPEQRKIADILTTWDEALTQLDALIEAQERRKKALMQQLLTGRRRLRGLTKPWISAKLGTLFKERVEQGRIELPLLSITADRGIVPREDVAKRDSSSEDKSKYLRIVPGDVGYNTMRMWQGVSALSSLEGIVSPAYTICTPTERIDGRFAAHFFKLRHTVHLFHRYSQGLVDDTLNLKFPNFAVIEVTVPSDLEEQRQIAAALDTADRQLTLLRTQRTALDQQKRGLMQRLLTGKLRVKP